MKMRHLTVASLFFVLLLVGVACCSASWSDRALIHRLSAARPIATHSPSSHMGGTSLEFLILGLSPKRSQTAVRP